MKILIKHFIKTNVLIFFLLTMFTQAYAQSGGDFQPITVKHSIFNTKYFYKDQIFESPYGLQIPLMQVNDVKIASDYNKFKKSAKAAKIVSLISTGISLYGLINSDKKPNDIYWSALSTSAAVSVFFNIRSTVFLNKAINRYNEKIAAPEIGFQYDNTQFGNDILGIGLKQRF